jgi:hypothetical protein
MVLVGCLLQGRGKSRRERIIGQTEEDVKFRAEREKSGMESESTIIPFHRDCRFLYIHGSLGRAILQRQREGFRRDGRGFQRLGVEDYDLYATDFNPPVKSRVTNFADPAVFAEDVATENGVVEEEGRVVAERVVVDRGFLDVELGIVLE